MKFLKLITIELIILAIVLASFIGIYKKDEYRVRNLVPDYKKGMSFTEQRKITLKVDDTVKETLIYDKDGNLIENKEAGVEYTEENGYKTVEVKTNDQSVLTKENYEKTKKIIRKRLKGLEIGEYKLALNHETGEITINIQENDKSDLVSYYLLQSGKFTLTDSQTGELLLDETHIKDIGLLYGSHLNDEAKTESFVYLQLKFDKEGTKKLEDLSKIYIAKPVENEENNAESNEESKAEEKKLNVVLNDTNMGSTVITNILYNNSITIILGSSVDQDEFTKQSENATNVVKVLKSGTLPIVYNQEEETIPEYTENKVKFENYQVLVIGITILICLYLVLRFKIRGVLATILQIGFLATILIVLRYTNVVITETGIIAIIVAGLLNLILLIQILKNKNTFNEIMIKYFKQNVPIYVIAIILAFSRLLILSSLGMVVAWGAIIIYVYNLLFTRNLIEYLKDGKSKK